MALQEQTKFASVQDVEMSGCTPISPVGLATEAARWDGLETGRRYSYLLTAAALPWVDNAFFIDGWLLVLVLSLDRRFLAGILAKVATVLR